MAIALAEVYVASRKGVDRKPRDAAYGEKIADLRREAGYTQEAVAARFSDPPLSKEGYRMYEKGYSHVRAEDLDRWGRAFGMPVTYIAAQLGINLYALPDDTSGLREWLAPHYGPDESAALEEFLLSMADLSPEDRRQIIEGLGDQIAGRHLRRQQPSRLLD